MKPGRAKRPGRKTGTRERILDASLQVFAEKGYSAATTKEIAKAAGVNEVTLFRLFKNKSALFAATLSERSPLVDISKLVSFDTNAKVEEVIVQNVKTVLAVLRANKHMFMVVLGDAWRQPRVRTMVSNLTFRRGLGFLSSFMKAQMDAGRLRRTDPEVPARALMGIVQSYFLMNDLLEGRKPDPSEEDRLIRGFVSVFLDGMRSETGGRSR